METAHGVARRIKSIRKRRRLTQAQLAERIDRSVDAVSNLERGLSLPSFETLERLSKALDVPIRDFFEFAGYAEDPARAELLASLLDAARQLTDEDLQVALSQIEALGRRGRPAQ